MALDAPVASILEAFKGHLTYLINRKPSCCWYFVTDKNVWCVWWLSSCYTPTTLSNVCLALLRI